MTNEKYWVGLVNGLMLETEAGYNEDGRHVTLRSKEYLDVFVKFLTIKDGRRDFRHEFLSKYGGEVCYATDSIRVLHASTRYQDSIQFLDSYETGERTASNFVAEMER